METKGDDVKKLREIVKDLDFGMLTTVGENGELHSRPMSTNGDIEFDGDLWFFTYGRSHKVFEVQQEPKVNVSFSSPEKQRYLSMSGTAELVRDKAKIEELWRPVLKAWFPKGLDEPDIALLKVSVDRAEYWDSPGSAVAHAFSMVKALFTGEQAKLGDHAQVRL